MKLLPSRNTGTPVTRRAQTVKSAVRSMNVGIRISPKGQANIRKASGKAMTRPKPVPSSVTASTGTVATTAKSRRLLMLATLPASQHAPSPPSTTMPGAHGAIDTCARLPRSRHMSQSATGNTRKQWL